MDRYVALPRHWRSTAAAGCTHTAQRIALKIPRGRWGGGIAGDHHGRRFKSFSSKNNARKGVEDAMLLGDLPISNFVETSHPIN